MCDDEGESHAKSPLSRDVLCRVRGDEVGIGRRSPTFAVRLSERSWP